MNMMAAPAMQAPIASRLSRKRMGMFANPNAAAPSRPASADAEMASPLGGSMRQPFNYAVAEKTLAGDQRKTSDWRIAAAVLGDTLTGLGGGQPWAMQHLRSRQQDQRDRLASARETVMNWQRDDWERQNAADLDAAAPFTIGRNRLQFNPATGETSTLYDGAEDFELYADSMGLQAGTPEYFRAVEDFVLRSSGPSAHGRDLELDDHRTDNDAHMEGIRQDNRIGLEGLRQRNRLGLEDTRQSNRTALRGGTRPSSGRGNVVAVTSPAEARQLPPGTRFRTPDGRIMRVPAN